MTPYRDYEQNCNCDSDMGCSGRCLRFPWWMLALLIGGVAFYAVSVLAVLWALLAASTGAGG